MSVLQRFLDNLRVGLKTVSYSHSMPLSTRTSSDHNAQTSLRTSEVLVAAGAFLFLCLAVLTKASAMLEPDDFAYRASIAALGAGHLVLTNAQYLALRHQLGSILQWDHLADGSWFSEKNPGYPFFAVVFYKAHLVRVAPLFYGGLASISLFCGARRWLGPWGGTWAVGLFCTSGAALAFAWRATMPSFTDASFVAMGAGLLLWTLLATDRSHRRRTVVGCLALASFVAAMFIRYTDVVPLLVAIGVIVATARWTQLRRSTFVTWAVLTAALVGGDMWFNTAFYGGPFKTGYSAGEITFSLSSFWPNLTSMPRFLVQTMPMLLLALISLGWIGVNAWRARAALLRDDETAAERRDVVVAVALAAGWAALWALYLCYTWTVHQAQGGASIHVIRFYLPALGAIALLGAWFLQRLPKWASLVIVAALAGYGVEVFHSIASGGLGGPGGPGGPGGHFPGGGPFGGGSGGQPSGGFPGGGGYGPPSGGYGPPSGGYGPPSGSYGPPTGNSVGLRN